MPNYYFGSCLLNNMTNGLGTTLLGKNVDMPVINPVTFPIARRDGLKKSGEFVDGRDINVLLQVIGSSRVDLMSRIDTLQQALALRSQNLIIHEDGRMFRSVDCLSAPVQFAAGKGVVQATIPCAFRAYDPYAYSATLSSYDTGIQTLTLSSSLWNFPAISITGGGNYYSYPLLHIINKTSTGSTTLTANRNSGTAYTTIAVAATSFSGSTGDQLTIAHGGTTQTLTASAGWSIGATSISVNSFTATANYVSSDVAAKVTQWTAITISQTQDSQTLSASSSSAVPLSSANADYVDIQCDPAQGYTVQTNSSGNYSDPISALFPVIEPGTTTINISIACASAVRAECVISWNARWLS